MFLIGELFVTVTSEGLWLHVQCTASYNMSDVHGGPLVGSWTVCRMADHDQASLLLLVFDYLYSGIRFQWWLCRIVCFSNNSRAVNWLYKDESNHFQSPNMFLSNQLFLIHLCCFLELHVSLKEAALTSSLH